MTSACPSVCLTVCWSKNVYCAVVGDAFMAFYACRFIHVPFVSILFCISFQYVCKCPLNVCLLSPFHFLSACCIHFVLRCLLFHLFSKYFVMLCCVVALLCLQLKIISCLLFKICIKQQSVWGCCFFFFWYALDIYICWENGWCY